jgi:hypothetical protein
MNGIICNPLLRVYVKTVHYGMILVIIIKFKESYCVSYLYPSNRTTEKGADALSGQTVNIPKNEDFRATALIQFAVPVKPIAKGYKLLFYLTTVTIHFLSAGLSSKTSICNERCVCWIWLLSASCRQAFPGLSFDIVRT